MIKTGVSLRNGEISCVLSYSRTVPDSAGKADLRRGSLNPKTLLGVTIFCNNNYSQLSLSGYLSKADTSLRWTVNLVPAEFHLFLCN